MLIAGAGGLAMRTVGEAMIEYTMVSFVPIGTFGYLVMIEYYRASCAVFFLDCRDTDNALGDDSSVDEHH